MTLKIELTIEEAQPSLAIRFRAPAEQLPAEVGRIYGEIISYLNGMEGVFPKAAYAAYHNMDMQDLDVEAGFTLNKPVKGKGEILESKVPAGKQVSCVYKGPYSKMESTYNAMTEWMKANHYTPTGAAYEFYLNSPTEVAESELLTRVMFPV